MKYFSVSNLCVLNIFLSFQLFVISALWSSQPYELQSFLVSKLFGPPKMSLVLRPWSSRSLIERYEIRVKEEDMRLRIFFRPVVLDAFCWLQVFICEIWGNKETEPLSKHKMPPTFLFTCTHFHLWLRQDPMYIVEVHQILLFLNVKSIWEPPKL